MKGLRIPVGVGANGGAALVEGDENDAKIIALALNDDDNENAFQQDISLGQSMIFDLNDPATQVSLTWRIEKIFEFFASQKRFELMKDGLKWLEEINENEQILPLELKYINLESDEPKTFKHRYNASD